MDLEQNLNLYFIGKSEKVGKYKGGLYELLSSGGCPLPSFNFSGVGKGSSKSRIELDGRIYIDLEKSTPNTTIMKEPLNEYLQNVYVHHDRGPGRVDTLAEINSIIEEMKVASMKAKNTRKDGY